ncbi:MAG: hypothetical protein Q9212_003037 [Teloschistes hypoglaucus]
MPPKKRHAAYHRSSRRGPKFTPPIINAGKSVRSPSRGLQHRHLASIENHLDCESNYVSGDCPRMDPANHKEDSSITLVMLINEKSLIDTSTECLRAKIEDLSCLKHTEAMEQLLELQEKLRSDVMVLKHELEGCGDSDPHWAERVTEETMTQKATAQTWTNNTEILASWLCRTFGQDQQRMELFQRECYGAEYEEGNGLREL